jgi:hypothetical protein
VPKHEKDDLFIYGGLVEDADATKIVATETGWFFHWGDNMWRRMPDLNVARSVCGFSRVFIF